MRMKKYIVNIKPIVRKKIFKLNPLLRVRIAKYIDKLEYFDDVFDTLDIKKLKWYENRYRLRVGKYRILFEKYEDKLVILVIDVWSRGDIYKNSRK